MDKWKDVSSYARGERGKVEPQTLELEGSRHRVCVTRRLHLDGWWLRDGRAGEPQRLKASDIEGALAEALVVVRRRMVGDLLSLVGLDADKADSYSVSIMQGAFDTIAEVSDKLVNALERLDETRGRLALKERDDCPVCGAVWVTRG